MIQRENSIIESDIMKDDYEKRLDQVEKSLNVISGCIVAMCALVALLIFALFWKKIL